MSQFPHRPSALVYTLQCWYCRRRVSCGVCACCSGFMRSELPKINHIKCCCSWFRCVLAEAAATTLLFLLFHRPVVDQESPKWETMANISTPLQPPSTAQQPTGIHWLLVLVIGWGTGPRETHHIRSSIVTRHYKAHLRAGKLVFLQHFDPNHTETLTVCRTILCKRTIPEHIYRPMVLVFDSTRGHIEK